MFNFLELFKKKKPPSIPTIKANATHKEDDKKQHRIFLQELEKLLSTSKLFKDEYISKYRSLYKIYKPFVGKDYSIISKQPYFFESLTDEAKLLKKNEIKKYSKNIVVLAYRRAYTEVSLNRFNDLVKEVTLIFSENDFLCEAMLVQKKKYHNKKMLISKAPIFPLTTCIKCPSCYMGVHYKPYIK